MSSDIQITEVLAVPKETINVLCLLLCPDKAMNYQAINNPTPFPWPRTSLPNRCCSQGYIMATPSDQKGENQLTVPQVLVMSSMYVERDSKRTTHWVKKSKSASSTKMSSTIYYPQQSRYPSRDFPYPSHLHVSACPNSVPVDYLESWLDDESQFVDPRWLEPPSRHVTNKPKSLETSRHTQQRSPKASPEKPIIDPPLPFVAAAHQLNRTIRLSILFFSAFHATFRETSDGLKFHAPQSLLNNIWQSQINASKTNPTQDWYTRKNKANNAQYLPPLHDKNKLPSQSAELFSFREVQAQVLSRVKALINSTLPILPEVASHYHILHADKQKANPQDYDAELDEAQMRYRAAETLKGKIKGCYEDLAHAMEMMAKDHAYAKQAIRELKIVKMQMVTYRVAWDEKYRDDGILDSDEEDAGGKWW
jgi:hypothetical protein